MISDMVVIRKSPPLPRLPGSQKTNPKFCDKRHKVNCYLCKCSCTIHYTIQGVLNNELTLRGIWIFLCSKNVKEEAQKSANQLSCCAAIGPVVSWPAYTFYSSTAHCFQKREYSDISQGLYIFETPCPVIYTEKTSYHVKQNINTENKIAYISFKEFSHVKD